MSTSNDVCESCAVAVPAESDFWAYDLSAEGQGRGRYITLCDDCYVAYTHAIHNDARDSDPLRAIACALGGVTEQVQP